MNLNLDTMDAEPAVEPVEVTPTEPAAAVPPPTEPVAAAPAAPVLTPVSTEPKHEVIPLARYLDDKKALQARIAELEAERTARATPEAKPPVDFMEDPKGYVDEKIQGATSKAEANEAELKEFREQRQINALLAEADVTQAEFAKTTPDYQAALEHVRDTRLAQLRLMDSTAPEAQLRQIIGREEVMGLVSAKQHGINPADLLYRYAQTLGYKPPVAAAPVTPAAVPVVPATPVPAPVVAAADVSAARSLGAGGGGGDATEEEENELTTALKARFRR